MTVEDRLRALRLIERLHNCLIAKGDPAKCQLCAVCEANLTLLKDLIERESEP
jgi:hypothetical protein